MTTMPATQPAPGQATRRSLRALVMPWLTGPAKNQTDKKYIRFFWIPCGSLALFLRTHLTMVSLTTSQWCLQPYARLTDP